MSTRALSHLQKNQLAIVRDQLVPWAQSPYPKTIVLAEPPLHVPPEIEVMPCPVPPISESGRGVSGSTMKFWRKVRLIATPMPVLGFVLEGEADYAVGATQRMAKACRQHDLRGRYVLRLPTHTCFVMPARVPRMGGDPHWEHALHPEEPFSRIFWISIYPSSVICHTCATNGKAHTTEPYLYLADPQITVIADLLIEELRNRQSNFEAAATAYLLNILLRIERKLSKKESITLVKEDENELTPFPVTVAKEHQDVLQRACRYIETHLGAELSPADVARHAYVSPSYLHSIFRTQLNQSVMGYVAQCRAETAKWLLTKTDLLITQVGVYVGHKNASHFTHSFRRWTGMSPLEYRNKYRSG